MSFKVLLIDDSGFEQVVQAALVEAQFYSGTVELAPTLCQGTQALWQLCREHVRWLPRLIILTTRFRSGTSGYRLLAFMQRHQRLRSIPVIMYSPSLDHVEGHFACKRGARLCLDPAADVPEVARMLWRVVPSQWDSCAYLPGGEG
jgi:CheY-like chemotaxis protein